MWEWYYISGFSDEFSGMTINRIEKERIDIGAFEWMLIIPPSGTIRYVTITGWTLPKYRELLFIR